MVCQGCLALGVEGSVVRPSHRRGVRRPSYAAIFLRRARPPLFLASLSTKTRHYKTASRRVLRGTLDKQALEELADAL